MNIFYRSKNETTKKIQTINNYGFLEVFENVLRWNRVSQFHGTNIGTSHK